MDDFDITIIALILIFLLIVGGIFYYANESDKNTEMLMNKLCSAHNGYLEGYRVMYDRKFNYYEVYCRAGKELITVEMK